MNGLPMTATIETMGPGLREPMHSFGPMDWALDQRHDEAERAFDIAIGRSLDAFVVLPHPKKETTFVARSVSQAGRHAATPKTHAVK